MGHRTLADYYQSVDRTGYDTAYTAYTADDTDYDTDHYTYSVVHSFAANSQWSTVFLPSQQPRQIFVVKTSSFIR